MVPTVLVVDDTESGRVSMRQALEAADFDLVVLEACDGAEALPQVLAGEVDVVVSDIVMPNLDGIGLLRGIRQHKDAEALPVILVTSEDDLAMRELSFEVGANDYLTRPYSPLELLSRIQVQLRIRRLQEELRRASERHRRMASHDELSGLANRRHLIDLSKRELARSRRYGFDLVVAVTEIDNFRAVTTRVGHLVADAVITEVAALLVREVRTPDIVARFSGGKFAALLPQTDAEQGRVVCERWGKAVISQALPGHEQGQLTLSTGSACYPGRGLESVDELFNAAEASLEGAQVGGGNCYRAWPGDS